jgi:4-amino-4-deoxy-L-arabinose transferase-like glycosyltransferase
MKRGERYVPAFLAAIAALQVLLAALWMYTDRTPPYWDEALYLHQGAVQLDTLRQQGIGAWYKVWITMERIRPPLVPTLTVPFYALFGIQPDAGLLANIGALVLLLLATYGLGANLENRHAGLLSALLVGSYPIILGLTHILLVEMVMIALVAMTLLALWRSGDFESTGWSISAGLLLGLGLLTKVFYFIFVIGPCFLTALWSIRREGRWVPDPRRLRNLLLCAFIACSLAATWYLPNLSPVVNRSVGAAVGEEASNYGPEHPLQFRNLYSYLVYFVGLDVSVIGFLAFVLGIVGLGVSRLPSQVSSQPELSNQRHGVLFLLASVLLGYAVFTSLRNQDPKQVTGILPGMAVLSGWGITRLARHRWPIAAAVLSLHMVFQALMGTVPDLLGSPEFHLVLGPAELFLVYPAQPSWNNTRQAKPDPRPWPIHEILAYALQVVDLETLPRGWAEVGVIPDYPGVEATTFIYEAYRKRMPMRIQWAGSAPVTDFDVLIHKTGNLGSDWLVPTMTRAVQMVERPGSEFQRMPRTFAIPGDGEVVIYGRKPSPLLGHAPAPARPCRVGFGGAARFLGFDTMVPAGRTDAPTLTVTYYWESLAATPRELKVFIHLLNPETGEVVAQDDHVLFPRIYPSTLWQAGRFLYERRTVSLPATFTGSALALHMGLYDEGGRVPVTSAGEGYVASKDSVDMGMPLPWTRERVGSSVILDQGWDVYMPPHMQYLPLVFCE